MDLGGFGRIWRDLDADFDGFGQILDRSWGDIAEILVISCGYFGEIFERVWADLGEFVGSFGQFSQRSWGRSWGHFGQILGRYCRVLSDIWRI